MRSIHRRDCWLRLTAGLLAWIAVASGAHATAAPAPPVTPTGGAVLARVQAWLDATETLRCDFEQELLSGTLGVGLRERGRLFIERPGKMRWEYRDPEAKIALVVGERTWLYLAEDAQLMLGRLDPDSRVIPELLTGHTPLDRLFSVEPTVTPAVEQGREVQTLRLVPREAEAGFEQVVVSVDPGDGALLAAEVFDVAGNRTRYRFHDFKRNRGVPPGTFAFEPPPGTLVSGEH